MDEKEIKALISLLDDPDNKVFEAIKIKLKNLGPQIIHQLENSWETSLDSLFQTRVENIIHEIHFDEIKKQLKQWAETDTNNLLAGAIIISRLQYPELDTDDIIKKFDKIKRDIWLEINDNLTALEKIKIINHILFDVNGFSRSTTFQNSAQSNFIQHVIEQKKGSPIALAILYAAIAQQLEIPVYGVALPKNFILCYQNQTQNAFEHEFENGVLFYINPFNKGIVFGKNEIELFIKQQKLENKKTYFQPCSNKETIIHLIKALIEFYQNNTDLLKIEEYNTLLKILYI